MVFIAMAQIPLNQILVIGGNVPRLPLYWRLYWSLPGRGPEHSRPACIAAVAGPLHLTPVHWTTPSRNKWQDLQQALAQ